ncbi:MAG: peptide ABC transporter ATP-binding protein [Burkholderiales bacterium RIFCSPHIGHO2_12_FULL_69_20]|nr:MAG: peptide ABC transporter ATP-binding protein [Burkholderiales bacterium RIFCSPHIGHO2_12_FULL_69_20]
MPWVFVGVWSTGFVVARLAMPHAPPLTFLTWRYAFSLLAFGLWIRAAGVAWPQGRAQWGHLSVSGVLMHAGYLGGVWAAVRAGMPAGTAALIVGLQPLFTALWVSGRGHYPVSVMQWLGLLLGLGGLVLVVWPKMGMGEVTAPNLALALLALASITIGTLYQKHHVRPADVRSANFVQIAAALVVTAPLALLEPGAMQFHPDLLVALAWSVLVLSLGGSSLLMMLIQRGAATRVTSLLYLVPPCTALLAWLLFGERMAASGWAGMALCAVGVGLVLRGDGR